MKRKVASKQQVESRHVSVAVEKWVDNAIYKATTGTAIDSIEAHIGKWWGGKCKLVFGNSVGVVGSCRSGGKSRPTDGAGQDWPNTETSEKLNEGELSHSEHIQNHNWDISEAKKGVKKPGGKLEELRKIIGVTLDFMPVEQGGKERASDV